MPTLPLYTPNRVADASHRVTAPGGYEWWYFDAESSEGDVQLAAILLHGFVFHPGYLRRYFQYRRRPTRVAPPTPGEYPCAYFVVYEHGRVLAQFMSQVAPGEYEASSSEPRVKVGNNRLWCKNDGRSLALELDDVPWDLTWRGPTRAPGRRLGAELTFRPRLTHPPHERVFLSRSLSSAEHHWVIASPLCDVEGRIRLGGGDGRKSREIQFFGRGYHDHNYGTAPIGIGLRRWTWGRVLLDDVALTFHFAEPRDPALPPEVHLVEASPAGVREVAVTEVKAAWSGRSKVMLRYPKVLTMVTADGMTLALTRPRLLDSAPFYLRLLYTASIGARVGTAFCEVAYPHRLRWPVLGRMIEQSIHRVDGQELTAEPPAV